MITGFLLNIAIFVVVAVVLLFLAISAVITFLMGDDNKSIVDQDRKPECEIDDEYQCFDCWKRGEK